MKSKKFKQLIQKPLRFHQQDIHEELDKIKQILLELSEQIKDIRNNEKS